MDVGKGREQERKLFRQIPSELAGNAASRYAHFGFAQESLGWPYSGILQSHAQLDLSPVG
ncbi:MAG TPA: hypothetical protein VIE65_05065 [Methylobacter sp.]